MKVSFHKKSDGRTVMTITRSDGSSTWSTLRRGMEIHDLAHLAVEKTLGCTDAFFAMIERGADIGDFEDKTKQPTITIQAQQVEHLVLLLQIEHQQGSLDEGFLDQYHRMLEKNDLPMLKDLTSDRLQVIRDYLTLCSRQLQALNLQEKMSFEVEV